MRSWICENHDRLKALLRAVAVLCLLSGAAGWMDAANAATPHSKDYLAGLNANFAIGDFDGDRKPDLATVEAQKGNSSNTTRYSIRVQLTAGGAQVFGVTAPAGGLRIVAADVNGDNALDVLVSTAWLNRQVAVLLNDGHGNFTLVDPAAFPLAQWESEGRWTVGDAPRCDGCALVRIERPASEANRGRLASSRGDFGKAPISVSVVPKRLLPFPLLGRAPPSFVLAS